MIGKFEFSLTFRLGQLDAGERAALLGTAADAPDGEAVHATLLEGWKSSPSKRSRAKDYLDDMEKLRRHTGAVEDWFLELGAEKEFTRQNGAESVLVRICDLAAPNRRRLDLAVAGPAQVRSGAPVQRPAAKRGNRFGFGSVICAGLICGGASRHLCRRGVRFPAAPAAVSRGHRFGFGDSSVTDLS